MRLMNKLLKKEKENTIIIDRKTFDNMILEYINRANGFIPDNKLPDLPFMETAPNVRDWHEYEHSLWEIGEEIRCFISANKKQLNDEQVEKLIKICNNPCAGRGRQSFVMLLGKAKFNKYASRLVDLLNDEDVDGHVICTLYKMKAYDYADYVKPFLQHKELWIIKEAERYIKKCCDNQV